MPIAEPTTLQTPEEREGRRIALRVHCNPLLRGVSELILEVAHV